MLQAFSGERYWTRDPTTAETWAMILLSFNHAAKAIMSWTFPATNTLNDAHAAFSKVATNSPVSTFLLNSEPVQVNAKGQPLLDIAYWTSASQIMVGFVNLAYLESDGSASIDIPLNATRLASQPWGSLTWSLSQQSSENTILKVQGLSGLDTSIVILDIQLHHTADLEDEYL